MKTIAHLTNIACPECMQQLYKEQALINQSTTPENIWVLVCKNGKCEQFQVKFRMPTINLVRV